MSLTLGYPRCYASEAWYSLPSTCGGQVSKQFQHFVKFTQDSPIEQITGWTGDTPTTGHWQGPPNPEWRPQLPAESPTSSSTAQSFLERVREFFELGTKATEAAKVAGYVAIAAVGAGLLVWYKPRKKR